MRLEDVDRMIAAQRAYEQARLRVFTGAFAPVSTVYQWVADGKAFRELLACTGAEVRKSMEFGGMEFAEYGGCVFQHPAGGGGDGR